MASELNKPHFKSADLARQYLEAQVWPNGPVCPHCGVISKAHYALQGKAHRPGLYKCFACREQFSVTVGTVFERSKIGLHIWLQAVYLLCSSKKGISSKQLERTLGVTYKTAWFMSHRIREAFKTTPTGTLGGEGKFVEADETYWGTEDGDKRGRGGAALVAANKIVSLVEREGHIRSFHVADVGSEQLKSLLTKNIDPATHVMTDSSPRYSLTKKAKPFAKFSQVNHSANEYVRGEAYTNTVEGYFSTLKRGLNGTYQHVSSHHLQRYVTEFDFRYNNRIALGMNDAERTDTALKGIRGKRLTYRRTQA